MMSLCLPGDASNQPPRGGDTAEVLVKHLQVAKRGLDFARRAGVVVEQFEAGTALHGVADIGCA